MEEISELTYPTYIYEGIKKYICEICNTDFDDLSSLKSHISYIHESKLKYHKCDLCDKSFDQEYDLKKHTLYIHEDLQNYEKINKLETLDSLNDDVVEKNKCDIAFSITAPNLDTDLVQVFGTIDESSSMDSFEDEIVGKELQSESNISCFPEDTKNYQGHKCNKSFGNQKDELEEHLKNHKEVKRKKYTCDICGKYFSDLKRHISCVHNHLKNYQCDMCHKAFGQLAHLKDHITIVHKGVKNYKCDKAFGLDLLICRVFDLPRKNGKCH